MKIKKAIKKALGNGGEALVMVGLVPAMGAHLLIEKVSPVTDTADALQKGAAVLPLVAFNPVFWAGCGLLAVDSIIK